MSSRKSISNTFTVNTMDDPVSVQAQYAPNNNPTPSQIHATWQDGDIYMRTRESDSSVWSGWHKIVGENGGETDYQFALSANLVTRDGTSATAPSDIPPSAWQDAPMSTTTQKPYLWSKVQKKDGNGNNVGNPSYIRLTGEKGKNAFVVDLENEMTNVALDENGDLIANFDMYFKVRAYYGTTNVLSDSACSVSASCSNQDVTITDTDAKTTGIRVRISSGTHILDTTEVSVTVTHTTYGTRTVIFTLAGVRGGKNAFLQELLPSLDAISFARTALGGLTPSSRDLTLSIKKTQGGSTSTQSISDSGLKIRWSSTSMPASKTDGNEWGSGTATGISWNNTTMQIANTVSATNIYIAAFNSAGTLVDREAIPVIKDGEDGLTPNQNILLRTVFDRGIDKVKEKWFQRLSWENIFVDTANDTVIMGRKSIRIVAPLYDYEDISERVYERDVHQGVKTNTWYTLSFYSFSGKQQSSTSEEKFFLHTYVYPESASACIDKSQVYVDGVQKTLGTVDGNVGWANAWTGARHTFTFKTLSSFPTNYVTVKFRVLAGGIGCICMPKLEEGKEATPYIPNDGDLIGNDGNDGNDATFFDIVTTIDNVRIPSNTTYTTLQSIPTATFYKIVGDNRQPISLYWSLYWRSGTTLTLNSRGGASTNCNLPTTYRTAYDSLVIFVYTESSTSTTSFVSKREISIVADGNSGERGAMSRNIYFAGKISEIKGTTFSVDDYQAPYVDVETGTEDSPNCYAFVGNNGSYTFNPSSSHYRDASEWVSGEKWTMMNTEFKYIISKAVFSQFAKLGSGIFNKDWMFSQYGLSGKVIRNTSMTQVSYSTYTLLPNMTNATYKLRVEAGKEYEVVIQCRSSSGSLFFKVFYNTNGDGVTVNQTGNQNISTPSTSNVSLYFKFLAEFSGYAFIGCQGSGYVGQITSNAYDDYQNMSPSFINNDEVKYISGHGAGANWEDVTYGNVFYVVAGMAYRLKASMAAVPSSDFVLSAYYADTDEQLGVANSSLTFNSGGSQYKEAAGDFVPSRSGFILFRGYSYGSRQWVEYVAIQPKNNFVPKVAIDWLSGYAHFGGDSTRFNPDGSGKLANGNITWTKDGDTNISGVLQADMMYSKTRYVQSVSGDYTYNINPSMYPSNIYKCTVNNGNLTIVLPNAGDYDGVEFRLLCSTSSRKALYIKCGSGDTIYYVDDDGGYGWTYTQEKVKVRYDCMVVLQNVNGTWYVISGKVTTKI